MAGSGYKNFTTGSVLTASDVQNYLMDQSVMVFAGTASRGSAITSPSEGMVVYLSDTDKVQVYNGTSWSDVGGAGAAVLSNTPTGTYTSGGTAYAYYEFTASGTATVTTGGFADVMVVGGGGGGYQYLSNGGAGGGGGCVRWQYINVPAGAYTVTIGAGGAGGNQTHGSASRFGSLVMSGGGSAPTDNRYNAIGGGGSSAAWNRVDGNQKHHGGGQGGTLYGVNEYDGVTLAYNNVSTEYGSAVAPGVNAAGATNRGQGGGWASNAGGSGIVIIRVRT